jgi:biopolymer transport protein ExbD
MAFIGGDPAAGRRALNHELPLVPFIDFLLCLVAFLLVTAVWTQAARLRADAKVPGKPDDAPGAPRKELHLAIRDAEFELSWKQGATVLDRKTIARKPTQAADGTLRYADLGDALDKEWKAHGVHQSIGDPTPDRAVLHSANATEYAEIVAVLDALHGTKRAVGSQIMPAFAVAFAID